ncbi:MAG: ABC transporter permease [Gemmatimonadaceae bacterium]
MKQMRAISVDSPALTVIVAAFIGSVIALQTRYQLFPGVQLSVVGLISRQMIILELGPLKTGLVLRAAVGARMTAERHHAGHGADRCARDPVVRPRGLPRGAARCWLAC